MCRCRRVNKKHWRSSEGIEESKEFVEILCYMHGARPRV